MDNIWVLAIPLGLIGFAIGFFSCWVCLRGVERENARLRGELGLAHLERALLEGAESGPQGAGEAG